MEEGGGELEGRAKHNGNVAHVHLVDVRLWREKTVKELYVLTFVTVTL